jgi:hypothetical protein
MRGLSILLALSLSTCLGCPQGGNWSDDDDDGPGDDDDSGPPSQCPDPDTLAEYEHSGTIGSETWPEARHRVTGDVWVEGLLTVEPCVRIEMGSGKSLHTNNGGALQILGEPDHPVTVTSSAGSPAPGDWDNIELAHPAEAGANVIRHAIIEYGGDSPFGAVRVESGVSMSMTDTTVRLSADRGVSLAFTAELTAFDGNVLTDNALGPIELPHDQAGMLGAGTYAPNDVEGIELVGLEVTGDQTWLAHDAPYLSDNGFTIVDKEGSALLTLEAGVVLKLGDNSSVRVDRNGGLTLAGTEAEPVTITSSAETPAPGDWGNIEVRVDSVSEHNDFDHAVIEYGGSTLFGCVEVWFDASVAITASTIQHCSDVGVEADVDAQLRDFAHNTVIDNADGAISIGANAVDQLGTGTYGPNDTEGVLVVLDDVDHTTTWLDLGVPYVADNGFDVEGMGSDAVLTLEAGTTLLLGEEASVVVRDSGGLTLDGTQGARIMVGSMAAAPAAGDWSHIELRGDSLAAHNVFRNTDISHGGSAPFGQLSLHYEAQVTLEHVTFSHAGGGCDIYNDQGTVDATATNWTDCI